jgi:radical SAM superfamily enzyme YgiQ (UPF0313 family)
MADALLKPSVVLVSDRTLSADYKALFEGIFGTMQTTQVPEIAMRNFVSPPVKSESTGRARSAILGIRRVEAALLKYTSLEANDIVCTTPEALGNMLGPWVKVVGVSSSDPLGNGMSNTTTTNFWKGELYTRYWTRKILQEIGRAKEKYGFKVIGGGAGAWQWSNYEDETAKKVLDVIFEGYFEKLGARIVEDLLLGNETEKHFIEESTAVENIQPIAGASVLGIVELSRGCGRGCRFCTMGRKKMEHVPSDVIIADLETNVAAGNRAVVSSSEDFFRYGAKGTKPEFDKLYNLLDQMREVKGLSFMQIDHGNITSVLQLTDDELAEIRKLLTWEAKSDYLWVNMGLESANGELVVANCPGKLSPWRAEDWEDMIKEAADKMSRNGFFSVFSLILGLPGETPDDVARTMEMVKYLETQRAVIFPVFYEPLRPEEIRDGIQFNISKFRADHLELYRRCYEINFREVPKLFWDNQRAGGVSWAKRAMMQMLGKGETRSWRRTFNKLGKQLSNNGQSRKTEGACSA